MIRSDLKKHKRQNESFKAVNPPICHEYRMRHHINHVPKSSMRSLLKDPIDGGMGPVKELSPVHVYVCMNMYVHNIFRDRQR